MKLGVLFSGGKDSCFAAYKAKQAGNELTCLITIHSENPDSYMFHTPSISKTEIQADAMNLPLLVHKTPGEKEEELKDLEDAIQIAKDKYGVEGIVTGAIESVYQSTRIQKICNKLNLECFNPLWQKNQMEYINELIKENFKIILLGVFAYPLNKFWLGREINNNFIEEMNKLKKYKINIAGEGGEFETFVLNCPLFKRELGVIDQKASSEGKNAHRLEVEIR